MGIIGSPTKEKKEMINNPSVDSFKVGGKLTGTLKGVASRLASISFLETSIENDAVTSAYVESRDINGKPYLFSLTRIKKNEISIVYSISPTTAPKKRRIDVIRQLLNILTVISDEYTISNKIIYNLVEMAIKDVGKLVDKKTSEIYVEYDTIKTENKILNKKNRVLKEENEKMNRTNYELKEENEKMKRKIKEYETPSDSVLKSRIIEWIKVHNGKINIPKFVSVYMKENLVGEKRVEQILNSLVTEGYVSSK